MKLRKLNKIYQTPENQFNQISLMILSKKEELKDMIPN